MRVKKIGGYYYLVIRVENNKNKLIPVSGLSEAAVKRWNCEAN